MHRRLLLKLLAGSAITPLAAELPELPAARPAFLGVDIGGTGTGATAIAIVRGGVITAISVTSTGSGYGSDGPPTITFGPPRQVSP